MTRQTVTRILISFAATLALAWLAVWLLLGPSGPFAPSVAASDGVAGPVVFMAASAMLLFFLHVAIGVGLFVYRDARQRGMEPLLWALVAVLVPYFIGVIIYLIVRQQPAGACPACTRPTVPGAAYCPHCGRSTKAACAGCQAALPGGARYCPACGLAAPFA